MIIGVGMKLVLVSLLSQSPFFAEQEGVGVGVIVGVSVAVGLGVTVDVGVGVSVFVGVGVNVGPNICPGPQAVSKRQKIKTMVAFFMVSLPCLESSKT